MGYRLRSLARGDKFYFVLMGKVRGPKRRRADRAQARVAVISLVTFCGVLLGKKVAPFHSPCSKHRLPSSTMALITSDCVAGRKGRTADGRHAAAAAGLPRAGHRGGGASMCRQSVRQM